MKRLKIKATKHLHVKLVEEALMEDGIDEEIIAEQQDNLLNEDKNTRN